MLYEEKGLRRVDVSIIVSIILHAALFALISRPGTKHTGSGEMLQQVSFMDVTYRPEVAKILPPSAIPAGGNSDLASASVPTYGSGVAADDVPSIDLSASLERDNSQAKIDMDRYELDRDGSGMDVIRLGGSGSDKSTDDILAQPKVQLARGLGRGSGQGIAGLRGFPGVAQPQAQLQIEHRQLEKPAARALPQVASADLPKIQAPVTSGSSFMVAGPISQRQINHKVVPRYPKWALDRRISGTVVVRIWVTPSGQIKGAPTVENSSGYPDLDQVVVDALRGWEFAALGAGVKSEDQWGVITFRFALS